MGDFATFWTWSVKCCWHHADVRNVSWSGRQKTFTSAGSMLTKFDLFIKQKIPQDVKILSWENIRLALSDWFRFQIETEHPHSIKGGFMVTSSQAGPGRSDRRFFRPGRFWSHILRPDWAVLIKFLTIILTDHNPILNETFECQP